MVRSGMRSENARKIYTDVEVAAGLSPASSSRPLPFSPTLGYLESEAMRKAEQVPDLCFPVEEKVRSGGLQYEDRTLKQPAFATHWSAPVPCIYFSDPEQTPNAKYMINRPEHGQCPLALTDFKEAPKMRVRA